MGSGVVKQMFSGRLDRPHYWMWLVGLIAGKVVLHKLSASSGAGAGLDIILLGVLIGRFHDFDVPTWSTVILWVGVCIAFPVAIAIAAHDASPATIGLASLPTLLLYVVSGLIPGNIGANSYGTPGQGFNSSASKRQPVQTESLQARRIASVTRARY